MVPQHYDFVIVGGGSAGSALANRLSADPGNRVLVLEAGRPDYPWDVFIHMPAALTFPIGSRFYDWKYESEPEPHMNGRRIYHARGKVLGGSSSINGMIFQRGNPLDYERWAADPGMETWDYAHCLPYFNRMENCLAADPEDEFRGRSGPLVLERGPASSPLFPAFMEAAQQAGYPLTDDVNGYRQEGFAAFDRTLHRGRRLSAARAYLHPAMKRRGLDVRTRAFVTRILFEGERAVGVEYRRGRGAPRQVRAGEVILCGGAINSRSCSSCPESATPTSCGPWTSTPSTTCRAWGEPAGPPGGVRPVRLQAAGFDAALPEVAPPAPDRPPVALAYGPRRDQPLRGRRFRAEQRGRRLPQPDVPLPADRGPLRRLRARRGPRLPGPRRPHVLRRPGLREDQEQGPRVHPALRFHYLSTEQDRREWVEAIRTARTILGQPGLAPYNDGEISPGPEVETDEQILDWVAREGETALHPSCTARMGTGEGAVTDPASLRVHGLEGLRVVDASVMPYVTNGNIYAPVMMVAEKAADLILGNEPLPPSKAEFYRHHRLRSEAEQGQSPGHT